MNFFKELWTEMEDETKSAFRLATMLILTVFVISVGVVTIKAYFEAKAYNRITGAHVSTWDAIFLELRVQACDDGNKMSK